MAKPNQVPESSMEEILASIRKIISEDEAKPAVLRPTLTPQHATALRPSNNVSRLFGDESAEHNEIIENEPVESSPDLAPMESTLSFPRYRKEEPAAALEPSDAVEAALSTPDWQPAEPRMPQQNTLLSPRADAAVTSAFNHLAGTILATNSRTIEQVAEDMMRPMLKEWLDDNLPPLVERLVREEIERVSRRR